MNLDNHGSKLFVKNLSDMRENLYSIHNSTTKILKKEKIKKIILNFHGH